MIRRVRYDWMHVSITFDWQSKGILVQIALRTVFSIEPVARSSMLPYAGLLKHDV